MPDMYAQNLYRGLTQTRIHIKIEVKKNKLTKNVPRLVSSHLRGCFFQNAAGSKLTISGEKLMRGSERQNHDKS